MSAVTTRVSSASQDSRPGNWSPYTVASDVPRGMTSSRKARAFGSSEASSRPALWASSMAPTMTADSSVSQILDIATIAAHQAIKA